MNIFFTSGGKPMETTATKALYRKFRVVSLFMFAILLGSTWSLYGDFYERKGWNHGLRTPTPEQIQQIKEQWPQIIGVRPNRLGAARIQYELGKNGCEETEFSFAESMEDEFITNKAENAEECVRALPDIPLPSHVDNSSLPSFPPIGDQGQEGCCVAFGSTYYQATHEVGLVNGTNNKASSNGILSPKWTYNMINGGGDNGSYPPQAFDLLSKNGAVSITKLPYKAGDFLAWDLETEHWIDAISNRTSGPQFVKGLGGKDPQNLTQIKQLLANGHILTFATFADSWVPAVVKRDPSPNAKNQFVGQAAISWVNGMQGGHYVTIVGYDDDVWIDVNSSGKVDAGEKGAFLVANSWGTGWGANGFVWVSYDAFLEKSAVVNGPNKGRVGMADAMNSLAVAITAKAHHYSPKVIAEFGLISTARDQVGISAGISDTKKTAPSTIFTSGAIKYQGGAYEFNGSKSNAPETATFALDLSDLADPSSSETFRFYLRVSDNARNHPTTLTSYSLHDLVNKQTVSAKELPKTVDNNTIVSYVDYNFQHIDSLDTTPPTAVITSPAEEGTTVHGLVPLTITATGDVAIARVELYLDYDTLPIQTIASAPYSFPLDTTKIRNGWHRVTIVAYDTSNNKGYACRWMIVRN